MAATLALGLVTARANYRATGITVRYAAGWNLVAFPTAQLLDQAVPPLYTYGPGSQAYQAIGLGDAVGGRAVWAYFPHEVSITLGATASEYTRVLTQPDQWAMAGDPSTSESLTVSGADAALAYDSIQGYVAVSELRPGQGAFVIRHAGGATAIGRLPAASGEAVVQNAQVSLSQDPTNRTTVDGVASATGEMIRARQYAAAQAAMDDLRSADADGLRTQGAAALPPLSESQRADAAAVRDDLAQADVASAAGDTATADAAVADATQTAQASEDDAVARARQQASQSQLVYMALGATPANLAAAGALLRAAFPAIGLGVAPTNDFWAVFTALLNGTALPPSQPAAAAAAPAPAMTPPALALQGTACVPATLVGFTVSGFPAGQTGQLRFDGSLVATLTIAGNGTGQGTFTVPSVGPGTYTVSFSTAGNPAVSASVFCQVPGSAPTTGIVIVGPRLMPTLSTVLVAATQTGTSITVPVGTPVVDQATLSGATSGAGGTVTYAVYAAGTNCRGAAVFTSTVSVVNGKVAPSAPFAPSSVGAFTAQASYSGDIRNTGAVSDCAAETILVQPAMPSISTRLNGGSQSGSSITVPVGTPVTDQATLAGATSRGAGTVTYSIFPSSASCTGSPLFSSTVGVMNGNVPPSAPFTPSSGGLYSVQAHYTGDANNSGATSSCSSEVLTVTQAPVITSANTTTFTEGMPGAFTVMTTGFPVPMVSESGTLPSGVGFAAQPNGTATLTGTPAAGTCGSYSLTFTASNGVSPDAVQPFTLTVMAPGGCSSPTP